MEKKASVKKVMNYPIESVWEVFTNREDISFRNEVAKFEKTGPDTFEETNHNGMVTKYKVITSKPYEHYKVEMENKMITGVFQMDLEKVDENTTNVSLHQVNEYKNILTYLTNSVFLNLTKVLNLYIFQVERQLKSLNITEK